MCHAMQHEILAHEAMVRSDTPLSRDDAGAQLSNDPALQAAGTMRSYVLAQMGSRSRDAINHPAVQRLSADQHAAQPRENLVHGCPDFELE